MLFKKDLDQNTTEPAKMVKPGTPSVHEYFMKQSASTWCIQNYIKYIHENLENEMIDFDHALSLFTESLDQINQNFGILLSIKSYCKSYLIWLKSCAGTATIQTCCSIFDSKKNFLEFNDAAKDGILSRVIWIFAPPRTPTQVHRDLTNLLSTPNKRPLGNEEFQHYSQEISIICAFGMTTEELMKEIGKELARELSTSRDNNPSKTGNNFRQAVLEHVSDIENVLFKSYCEKVLLNFSHIFDVHSTMPQDIGECKYIIYLVASLFKFYETTFDYLYFDWIESHACAAKMINRMPTKKI
uniref:Uncharacterized protein n=1 Tax=Rhizophagus irregularis (strain DAOM 181602 / DAOM 197198 / MUCL 43194) TaxID=747089 RepID=U9UEL8_RHIID